MSITTHSIEIKILAPPDSTLVNSYHRRNVFNLTMETDLSVSVVQQLVTEVFTKLTALSTPAVKSSK